MRENRRDNNRKREEVKFVRLVDAKKYIISLLKNTRNSNVYVLVRGAVGSGKTDFISKTLEKIIVGDATSPSHSYMNKYDVVDKDLTHKNVYHVDMYKLRNLAEKSDMTEVITETLESEKGIFFVEWPTSDVLFSSLNNGQVVVITMKEEFKCQINFLKNSLMTENKIKMQEKYDRENNERGGRFGDSPSYGDRNRGGRSGGGNFNRGGDRDRRSGGGFNRDRNSGGGNFNRGGDRDRRSGGGFNRDRNSGGYNRGGDRDGRDSGGYNRGGDRDRRSGGGFNRDRNSGGDRDRRSGGGFNRDRNSGGGNFNRGGDRDRRSGGGFNRDRNSGGGNFNRGGDRDRRSGGDRDRRSGGRPSKEHGSSNNGE